MYLVKRNYSPAQEILNNFFEGEFNRNARRNCSTPAANIIENNDSFSILIAAPGLNKEDFKLSLEKDILTISSEKEVNNENISFMRKEFETGSFSRSFFVPETVDYEQIKAEYNNGILTVNLPKKPEKVSLSKQIEIA